MKLLYICYTTKPWIHNHVFIKDVWKSLSADSEAKIMSLLFEDIDKPVSFYDDEHRWFSLTIPNSYRKDFNRVVDEIASVFKQLSPEIIHSNLYEGYEIAAAKEVGIPIVNTIHLGGMFCPRSLSDGFLRYDDSQCNQKIGMKCRKCLAQNLPLPGVSHLINLALPRRLKDFCREKLNKQIFYFTPLLNIDSDIRHRQFLINEVYPYTTFICANERLKELLELNGLTNTVVIPHGVNPRKRLSFPEIKDKLKFYYVGRLHYSKGIHVMIKAFEDMPNDKYELHIIGPMISSSHRTTSYCKQLRKLAKGKNVFFEGEIPNDDLEESIRDYHVMIHPVIYHEVYGLTIAESLAMGRPVLATRCGGAEMQVRDGENGWLISSNSVEEMTTKIKELLDNLKHVKECVSDCYLPNPMDNYLTNLNNLYTSFINGTRSN